MPQGNDNLREEYARQRVKNSPLSSLLKNPTYLPSVNFPPVANNQQAPLDVHSYKFIQNAVVDTISQVIFNGKCEQLSVVCDTICTETRNIEAMGVDYLREYMRELELDVEVDLEEQDDDDDDDNEDEEKDIRNANN